MHRYVVPGQEGVPIPLDTSTLVCGGLAPTRPLCRRSRRPLVGFQQPACALRLLGVFSYSSAIRARTLLPSRVVLRFVFRFVVRFVFRLILRFVLPPSRSPPPPPPPPQTGP
jgi:hypothetical protein